MTTPPRIVRALFTAARTAAAAPYDRIHLKVLYPALRTNDEAERQLGLMRADPAGAPHPVIVFLNGMSCEPTQYQWLLTNLVLRGMIGVLVHAVDEAMPGFPSLTPGIDLGAVRPDSYGKGPPGSSIAPALDALAVENERGPLAGRIDLRRVILGGHSAGGTVALESADRRYFPNIAAAFSYAAHTGASTLLGWPAGTVLPIASDLPMMLLGGTEDGVIAASSGRYGLEAGPDFLLRKTFEGIRGDRGDRYLAILRGANHFTLAHPADPTAGRAFLDGPPSGDQADLRALIAALVGDFLEAHVLGRDDARRALEARLGSPDVTLRKRR